MANGFAWRHHLSAFHKICSRNTRSKYYKDISCIVDRSISCSVSLIRSKVLWSGNIECVKKRNWKEFTQTTSIWSACPISLSPKSLIRQKVRKLAKQVKGQHSWWHHLVLCYLLVNIEYTSICVSDKNGPNKEKTNKMYKFSTPCDLNNLRR